LIFRTLLDTEFSQTKRRQVVASFFSQANTTFEFLKNFPLPKIGGGIEKLCPLRIIDGQHGLSMQLNFQPT